MSARIQKRFAALQAEGRKALIPYISGGDPNPEETVAILHALVESGADLLELGIAFSDPAADGKIIQEAHERALARGVTLYQVLDMVRLFRVTDAETPLILMGYLNSFERHGFAAASALAAQAGADGVILVDCPIEALPDYHNALQAADLAPIQLIAPTTSAIRADKILAAGRGFLYYVSLRGVTGSREADPGAIAAAVNTLKARTALPLVIGFGIQNAPTARAIATCSDGVVIGSALVATLYRAAQDGSDLPRAARDFLSPVRSALDARGRKKEHI